jgi:putative tryptophan/tyrosine transport system substrate-binding protein
LPPPKCKSFFMRWLVRTQGGSRLILKPWPPARCVTCVAGPLTALRRAAGLRWAATTLLLLNLMAQAALAQQASQVPRVGILSPYVVSGSSFQDDVKRGLTDLGYVEGATVVYETRFADGRTDRLPALATDLVRLKVDVIVTTTAPAVRAAMQATTAIPIVMGGVDDAVEQGIVASLAKPGGNVTGTSWLNVELTEKRLDLLKQALPGLSRVAVLREAVGAGATARAAMTAAQALGLQVYILEVRAPNELDDAFSEMGRIGVGALSVLESPMIAAEGSRIAYLALRHRIPAIFPDRRFLEVGGLMSYGPSLPRMYRQAATHIDRIIKGAKPAELPVEQPTLFALVVNQRVARLLGLTLSETIFVRADEIIE